VRHTAAVHRPANDTLPVEPHQLGPPVLVWGEDNEPGTGLARDTPRRGPVGHSVRGHQRDIGNGRNRRVWPTTHVPHPPGRSPTLTVSPHTPISIAVRDIGQLPVPLGTTFSTETTSVPGGRAPREQDRHRNRRTPPEVISGRYRSRMAAKRRRPEANNANHVGVASAHPAGPSPNT
jgi:hypothetical protein